MTETLTSEELLALLTAAVQHEVLHAGLDAGLVAGRLELSDDGKALKYFELVPFELRITPETVLSALAADGPAAGSADGSRGDDNPTQALETEESDQ